MSHIKLISALASDVDDLALCFQGHRSDWVVTCGRWLASVAVFWPVCLHHFSTAAGKHLTIFRQFTARKRSHVTLILQLLHNEIELRVGLDADSWALILNFIVSFLGCARQLLLVTHTRKAVILNGSDSNHCVDSIFRSGWEAHEWHALLQQSINQILTERFDLFTSDWTLFASFS